MAKEKKINIQFFLNERVQPNEDGEYPLYVQITFNRKTTKFRALPRNKYSALIKMLPATHEGKNLDDDKESIILKNLPQFESLTTDILEKLVRYDFKFFNGKTTLKGFAGRLEDIYGLELVYLFESPKRIIEDYFSIRFKTDFLFHASYSSEGISDLIYVLHLSKYFLNGVKNLKLILSPMFEDIITTYILLGAFGKEKFELDIITQELKDDSDCYFSFQWIALSLREKFSTFLKKLSPKKLESMISRPIVKEFLNEFPYVPSRSKDYVLVIDKLIDNEIRFGYHGAKYLNLLR